MNRVSNYLFAYYSFFLWQVFIEMVGRVYNFQIRSHTENVDKKLITCSVWHIIYCFTVEMKEFEKKMTSVVLGLQLALTIFQ